MQLLCHGLVVDVLLALASTLFCVRFLGVGRLLDRGQLGLGLFLGERACLDRGLQLLGHGLVVDVLLAFGVTFLGLERMQHGLGLFFGELPCLHRRLEPLGNRVVVLGISDPAGNHQSRQRKHSRLQPT